MSQAPTKPDTPAHIVTISESRAETPELSFVQLAPAGAELGYAIPGQYVKLELPDGASSMFAIASAPAVPSLEFIVKRGAPFVDAWLALPAGTTIKTSTAQGKGFPLGAARGKDLLLFAVGSGLAPMRAVLGAVVGERSAFGAVTMFEGQRTAEHFGWPAERAAWRAAGITLVEVASRPEGGWSGRAGYLQSVLLEDRPALSPERSLAFLCGMKPMVEAVRAALAELGLPREHTHLNY